MASTKADQFLELVAELDRVNTSTNVDKDQVKVSVCVNALITLYVSRLFQFFCTQKKTIISLFVLL